MKLRLFTLGILLCFSALAAPNECGRCGRHSSRPATTTTTATPATAATPATGEQSSLLISRLLYI